MTEKLIKFSEMSNMKEGRVRLSMLNENVHIQFISIWWWLQMNATNKNLVWIEMEIAVNEFYWNFKFDLFFELHTKYLRFNFVAVCADSTRVSRVPFDACCGRANLDENLLGRWSEQNPIGNRCDGYESMLRCKIDEYLRKTGGEWTYCDVVIAFSLYALLKLHRTVLQTKQHWNKGERGSKVETLQWHDNKLSIANWWRRDSQ